MKKTYATWLSSLLFTMLLLIPGVVLSQSVVLSKTTVGVISYWGTDPALYNQLPGDSLAIINPNNGIFISAGQTSQLVDDLAQHRAIVDMQAARGVKMFGYVPTGYFNHICNINGTCQTKERIRDQVAAYFAEMPNLAGIFFDEVAPSKWDCRAFKDEYQLLRYIVKDIRPDALIAFNVGVANKCVVEGVNAGEIISLFESSYYEYLDQFDNIIAATEAAKAKGALVWHLVHSTKDVNKMNKIINYSIKHNVDYIYVTDIGGNWQAGENTWGSLPAYWGSELSALGIANNSGVNWGNLTKKLVVANNHLCLQSGEQGLLDVENCSKVLAWQLTALKQNEANYYQLKYNNKCAASADVGKGIIVTDCQNSSPAQHWQMKTEGGLVYFENRLNNLVLSLSMSASAPTMAVFDVYRQDNSQLFYFN